VWEGGRERRKYRIPVQAVKDVDHACTYFIKGGWERKLPAHVL